jgi:hypothetical protein
MIPLLATISVPYLRATAGRILLTLLGAGSVLAGLQTE